MVELRFTMCKQKTVVSHEGPLSLENTRNGAQVPHGEIYGLFCAARPSTLSPFEKIIRRKYSMLVFETSGNSPKKIVTIALQMRGYLACVVGMPIPLRVC